MMKRQRSDADQAARPPLQSSQPQTGGSVAGGGDPHDRARGTATPVPAARGRAEAPPAVGVVIVAYNNRADLERCLPSLREGQGVPLEVVVVDNGSTDGTVAWLAAGHPWVRVVQAAGNGGYAGGNNLGARVAPGEYLLMLNPDTVAHPGAVDEMVRVAMAHPGALVTPKLVRPDGRVNACGTRMHYAGITTCVGLGEAPEAYRGVLPALLASGAALLARRADWDAVGGFSPDFFMYMEDVDLSLRARLLGLEILCAADAVVEHDYDLAMSPRKFYYLERNRLLTLLRVFEARTLWRLGVGLALTEAATWCFALLRGPAYVSARLRGYAWIWRHRAAWRRERRRIQAARTVPDQRLIARMEVGLPYGQLVSAPWLARLLERTTTVLFRLGVPRGVGA